MTIAKPVILGNGAPLSRSGTEGFTIGTPIVLTLQSVVGYSSFAWTLLSKPAGSASTLATPTTTASSLTADVSGNYKIRGTATGADGSVTAIVVAVVLRTPNRSLRKLGPDENFVDNLDTARAAYNEVVQSLDDDATQSIRVGVTALVMATDADRVVTPTEAAKRVLNVTSSVPLTAQRDVTIPAAGVGDPWWWIFNGTTGDHLLNVRTAAGTGVLVAPGELRAVFYDGSGGMVG